MQAFRDTYLVGPERPMGERLRVLDLGAMAYSAQESYRPLFAAPGFDYVGLDVATGPNVDVVVDDPHCWAEVPTASFDVVISGQALEHDPQFWVTLAEVARVLRPGGYACLIAPSTGPVHRYPVDCWRFYPDAGPALLTWAGLEPVESHVEQRTRGKGPGIEWQDLMVIGRKPFLDDEAHARMLERLAAIVALRMPSPAPNLTATLRGPAADRFEAGATVPLWQRRPYPLRAWMARTKFRVWNRLSPEMQARVDRLRHRQQ
jgi:SAM-dependent methyltransferase